VSEFGVDFVASEVCKWVTVLVESITGGHDSVPAVADST
jgi:hypothetical protein